MSKIKCEICDCNVAINNLTQHKQGKKHKYYEEIYLNTGQYRVNPKTKFKIYERKMDIIILNEVSMFSELDSLFSEKMEPFYRMKYYDKTVLEKVLFLFYSTLFNFNEEMELDEKEIECIKEYLFLKHNIDEINLDNEKIVSLLILSLNDDKLDLSKEIQLISNYDNLKILMEENVDEAQHLIQENHKKNVEEYLKLYVEAKNEFYEVLN